MSPLKGNNLLQRENQPPSPRKTPIVPCELLECELTTNHYQSYHIDLA